MKRPRPVLLLVVLAAALALLAGAVVSPAPARADHNPDPPTNLRVTARTTTNITITWDQPASTINVNYCDIDWKRATDATWQDVAVPSVSIPRTRDLGFSVSPPGTTFDFRVRSCQDANAQHCSSTAAQVTTATLLMDHDGDDDGLIGVTTLAQLNAIRYDLDGNGTVTDDASTTSINEASEYAAAFTGANIGMGCPAENCLGYELLNDLNFDENGDREITSADAAYWNGGTGWVPIKDQRIEFSATLLGNGHVIDHLYINDQALGSQGLFRILGATGVVSHLGLTNVNVTAGTRTGALAADNSGTVSAVYVTGSVTGADDAGGIIGSNVGTISNSYVAGFVSGANRVGGIVGSMDPFLSSDNPRVVASYSTAAVSGTDNVGGLVGVARAEQADVNVIASYASGPVSGTGSNVGGLMGQSVTQGGHSVNVTDSYFDTNLTGQTHATRGQTTAQLQSPTDYAGIYANWQNPDVDGDANTVDTNDFWHFGNTDQYPALKADFDDDTTATWPEFGYQLRERPDLTLNPDEDGTGATLSWTEVHNTHWTPNPVLTYQVRKNGAALGSPADATSARDEDFTPAGDYNAHYRVEALLNGAHARTGNTIIPDPPTAIDLTLDPTSVDENAGQPAIITVTAAYRAAGRCPRPPPSAYSWTGTPPRRAPTTEPSVPSPASPSRRARTAAPPPSASRPPTIWTPRATRPSP